MRLRTLSRRSFAPGISSAIIALLLLFAGLPLPDLGSAAGVRFACSCEIRMPCCLAQRCALGSPGHHGGAHANGNRVAPTLHSCRGGEATHLSPGPTLPALPLAPFRLSLATVAAPAPSPAPPSPVRSAGDVEVPPPRVLAA